MSRPSSTFCSVYSTLVSYQYSNLSVASKQAVLTKFHQGPEVAFNAYIASCTLFLNLSYALPVMILLVRGRHVVAASPPEFYLGKGLFGYATNWISVLFVLVTSVVRTKLNSIYYLETILTQLGVVLLLPASDSHRHLYHE